MVDSQRHTFQASGRLWQDALVMQDLETKSLWSQISGKAIDGPLIGNELTLFPSSQTTYGEFKKLYPNGVVLQRPAKEQEGSPYGKYFADSTKLGIFGRVDDFSRLPGKDKVFGVRLGGRDVAVSLEKLEKESVVIIENIDPPVFVVYEKESESAFAYIADGLTTKQVKTLSLNNSALTLPDSSASWSLATGKLIDGGSNSEELESVALISSFWFAWVSFFPNTELIQ